MPLLLALEEAVPCQTDSHPESQSRSIRVLDEAEIECAQKQFALACLIPCSAIPTLVCRVVAPAAALERAQSATQGRVRRCVWRKTSSPDCPERAFPTGHVKEVQHYVAQKSNPVAHALLQIFVGRRFKGPVNQHGPADEVLLGNKSPVPAVIADVAVIAHAEITIRA